MSELTKDQLLKQQTEAFFNTANGLTPEDTKQLSNLLHDTDPSKATAVIDEHFQKRLDSYGLTKEELKKVALDIAFNGIYKEEFLILGKIKVIFGTRFHADSIRAINRVDGMGFSSRINANALISTYNLAASLYQYGNVVLAHLPHDDESFAVSLKQVEVLPSVVVDKLFKKLESFDFKVGMAMDSNFLENL